MANQNLSQFGEKLFVADADHTFIWDSAVSISKRVSRNSWLNSGTLTSDAPVTISQTWDQIGTTFTAFKVNAVSTASASGSLLLDLQVGGVTKFKVDKTGSLNIANGSFLLRDNVSGANEIRFLDNGLLFRNASETPVIRVTSGGLHVRVDGVIGFGSPLSVTPETTLAQDAANTLALRNGETNQKFHVYATYSNASNYRRCVLGSFDGANFDIQTEGLGTGAAGGALNFGTAGARRMTITTAGNVGIGTTSPTSKLHVAETWNAAGTTFAAAKIVVTDTASAAASTLLELWSDSVTPTLKYSFGKSGVFKILGGNNSEINCNQLVTNNGTAGNTDWGVYLTNSSGIILKNTLSLGWSNGVATLGADTILLRDGEQDHLAMRRSTNGQKFSVYGTYPGANWERFTITAPTSGNVLLGTYKGTGGIARGLEFQADGVTRMTLGTTEITTTVPFTASGLGKFVGIQLGISGSSRLVSPGYGIATFLDSDGTGNFTKLNLAGNTDSFPSLKRSTTRIQAVLATTDTTFTNIQGKLTTDTDFTATVVTPTGFLTLYDAQGTAYRVPCVAAP